MYVPYTYACHFVHRNDNHQCSFFRSVSLSSCRRTELNCGNKANERQREREREKERDDFVHSFILFSPSLARFLMRIIRGKTREEKRMSIKPQTHAV